MDVRRALWALLIVGCTGTVDTELGPGSAPAPLGVEPDEWIPGLGVQTGQPLAWWSLDHFPANHVSLARVNFIMVDGQTADADGGVYWWAYDDVVRDHALRGVQILPVLIRQTPEGYVRFVPGSDLERWGRFAESLARRYGPDGEYWAGTPDVPPAPIRAWEIWNEPNLERFWDSREDVEVRPDVRRYRRMLRAAFAGLRRADPRARVVVGGLAIASGEPNVPMRRYLGELLDGRASNRCIFDAVAIHPYADQVGAVVDNVHDVVGILRDAGVGDDTQVWITELGWSVPVPGAWPRCTEHQGGRCVAWADRFLVDGEPEQAARMSRVLGELDARAGAWRLGPTVWYSFTDLGGRDWDSFCGLFTTDGRARPAWWRLGEIANGRWTYLPPVRCEVSDDELRAGDQDDAASDSADVVSELLPVARLWHPRQMLHLYSRNAAEVAGTNWVVEADPYFHLWPWWTEGYVPFYRCYVGPGHLFTTSEACEGAPGAVNEGAMGMIAAWPLEGHVALHRLYHPGNQDHFYTTSREEVGSAQGVGYAYEGVAGYVLP
jgi:hypothetical protein